MNGVKPNSRQVFRDTGVLVQEVDDGQPCLACDKCQGFEQHSWRKTCSSCKCPRESHDVYHEEWVNVRERLGLKSQPDQDKQGPWRGYAWVPPNLNQYKVEQYFRNLPVEKVPKLGTPGEKYREKQIMSQLPKQDMALAYCRHVEPGQAAGYEDFITARNEIALDIAYAKECMNRVVRIS